MAGSTSSSFSLSLCSVSLILAIRASSAEAAPQILGQNVTDLIRPYIGYLTFGIDIAAGIIIGISAFMALIAFFRILNKPKEEQTVEKETIRLRLARGMLLALDFEVGSDILKTILVPSVTELTILGVVVGIRIVLSWSLSKEINRHSINAQEQQAKKVGGPPPPEQQGLKQKDSKMSGSSTANAANQKEDA